MTPTFSIIVPVYNVRNYIEVSIKSILAQTFSDFELLAVDDGSNDGSGEYLDMIAAADKRVRVFHQPNSGVSAARNLGLDNARGEWIAFVDGDDALREDALEILNLCIEKIHNVDLIGYGSNQVAEITPSSLNARYFDLVNDIVVRDCIQMTCFNVLNHYTVWSEVFRRDILGDLRFEQLKNGEDVLFCNSVGLRSNVYASINAPLYLYLQRERSARTNEWSIRRMEDYNSLNAGIFQNIITTSKIVEAPWLKRWVGSLLQYVPESSTFDRRIQRKFRKNHRALLQRVKGIRGLPQYLKLWISISILVDSKIWYWLTAMFPMKLYSKSKK